MVSLYRDSPEYQDVMRIVGPEEVAIVDKVQGANDFPEHTYPTSFGYVGPLFLFILIF
jgi:hypothetical protein